MYHISDYFDTKIDKTVDNRYITQFWTHYIYPLYYAVIIFVCYTIYTIPAI